MDSEVMRRVGDCAAETLADPRVSRCRKGSFSFAQDDTVISGRVVSSTAAAWQNSVASRRCNGYRCADSGGQDESQHGSGRPGCHCAFCVRRVLVHDVRGSVARGHAAVAGGNPDLHGASHVLAVPHFVYLQLRHGAGDCMGAGLAMPLWQ